VITASADLRLRLKESSHASSVTPSLEAVALNCHNPAREDVCRRDRPALSVKILDWPVSENLAQFSSRAV